MAYQIAYQWDKESKLRKNHRRSPWIGLVLLVVISVLMFQLRNIETEPVIRQLLHPWMDPQTAEAFEVMVTQVGDGVSVAEALTAFCISVLKYAG